MRGMPRERDASLGKCLISPTMYHASRRCYNRAPVVDKSVSQSTPTGCGSPLGDHVASAPPLSSSALQVTP